MNEIASKAGKILSPLQLAHLQVAKQYRARCYVVIDGIQHVEFDGTTTFVFEDEKVTPWAYPWEKYDFQDIERSPQDPKAGRFFNAKTKQGMEVFHV